MCLKFPVELRCERRPFCVRIGPSRQLLTRLSQQQITTNSFVNEFQAPRVGCVPVLVWHTLSIKRYVGILGQPKIRRCEVGEQRLFAWPPVPVALIAMTSAAAEEVITALLLRSELHLAALHVIVFR